MNLVPAPSINDLRTQALMGLLGRLDTLDLSGLLVYRIPSVPETALKFLAWQFDVLDPEWQLLTTSAGESIDALTDIDSLTDIDTLDSPGSIAGPSDWDSYRALLLQAIPLHRTRGTPYAIKTALAALGWPNAILQEGQNSWGGVSWPSGEGWAVFRVLINLSAGQTVTAAQSAAVIAALNFFKPQRCWLDSLWFTVPPFLDSLNITDSLSGSPVDALDITDALSVVIPTILDTIQNPVIYNAQFDHSGVTYANEPVGISDGAITVNGTPEEGNK